MRTVSFHEAKDDLSRDRRDAENEEIVITRHGGPAGVLIGFSSEDDWSNRRLEHAERFLLRIARARRSIAAGKGIKLGDIDLSRPTCLSCRDRGFGTRQSAPL